MACVRETIETARRHPCFQTLPGIAIPRTSEPFCRLLKRFCRTSSSAPEMGPVLGLGGYRRGMHVEFAGNENKTVILASQELRSRAGYVLSDGWTEAGEAQSADP